MDMYLENPGLLRGTPKRSIADYVESQGGLVPARYDDLSDAMGSGARFMVRGEHPQDYDGVSNLFPSFIVDPRDPELKSMDDIWGKVREEANFSHIQLYAQLTGVDPEEVLSGLSFSFWEFIPGRNKAVVADNAVKGRYHIFTVEELVPGEKVYANYTIFENGASVLSEPKYVDVLDRRVPVTDSECRETIAFYESIRHLSNFNSSHCPIIEIQTAGRENYFLQYHRTRDCEPADFVLDRDPEPGEVEVSFLRGATRGVEGRVLLWPPATQIMSENIFFPHGAHQRMFTEVMAKQQGVHVLIDRVENIGAGLVDSSHTYRSIIFKPDVFMTLPSQYALVTEAEEDAMIEGSPPHIPIRVISDGKRGFIKRLD